jgi:hypothetical protein
MRGFASLLFVLCAACGQAQMQPLLTDEPDEPDDAMPATSKSAVVAEQDPALRREIDLTMQQLSEARGLAIKREVAGRKLNRDEVIKLIMAKTERELPKGVLEAQGHVLRGLGLTKPDYDFVGGIYDLLRNNVAGFYEQHDEAMYLLDDLNESGAHETLVHELEHALQDQHFDLKSMLKYTPGDTDRIAAAHALCEGDATSAMFEVSLGSAFHVSERTLRMAMVASVALVEGGADTPRILQASLVAPYVDGFKFVQDLRRRGGWKAVDFAFRNLPKSTEQLLHLDKFDKREPPIIVPEPPMPAPGFQKRDADVLGEQGLRMVFEQWALNKDASAAAAGWGGDRYLIASRGDDIAIAWHVRFDDEAEAKEAAALMSAKHAACTERSNLGPFAWEHRGDAIAIAAGPFKASNLENLASRGDCKAATAWLDAILATR